MNNLLYNYQNQIQFTLMFVLPEKNMINIKRNPSDILETKIRLISMFQI